ncbi:MAG TPA: hypothetical protein VFJ90_07810 [Candidatus Didemnitutus sp.]|nr:hypothetical protein [Candidatus Didemnitutus sp.]
MPKYTANDWDEVRKKFRNSIMADTSLVSLAQNLDMKEWPHTGEEEKPSKYIDFSFDELMMMPEIQGKSDRVDHLVQILKETLAFDDPFGDMVAQVEQSATKENPILKTLARLGIPENFPLQLANLSEGTRAVCSGEGIKTIGEFATLGQQMSTRVVLGGDFRNALNALTHGDEEGIGKFLPYRKGVSGLHLPEAVGLVVASLSRLDQVSLGKYFGAKLGAGDAVAVNPLTKDQADRLEASLRPNTLVAFDWFKDQKTVFLRSVGEGLTLERFFLVLNDPAREAVAVRLTANVLQAEIAAARGSGAGAASEVAAEPKKKGLFSRLFGKG